MLDPAGPEHVASTWGSWLAGGVAVPLCLSHPPKCALSFLPDKDSDGFLPDKGSDAAPLSNGGCCYRLAPVCSILAAHWSLTPAVGGFMCYMLHRRHESPPVPPSVGSWHTWWRIRRRLSCWRPSSTLRRWSPLRALPARRSRCHKPRAEVKKSFRLSTARRGDGAHCALCRRSVAGAAS